MSITELIYLKRTVFLALFCSQMIPLICQDTTAYYYGNGNLFSLTIRTDTEDYLLSYKLNPDGDTIYLKYYDYRGALKDFREKSYTKNLEGEITSKNNKGVFNHYTLEKGALLLKDSSPIYHHYSLFYSFKRMFNLDMERILQLDTLFINSFHYYKDLTRDEYIEQTLIYSKSIDIPDSIDLMPYILISSEMLYEPFEEHRGRKHKMAHYQRVSIYKEFNNEIKTEKSINAIHDYFTSQADITKGMWLYHSILMKYAINKMPEKDHLSVYKYAIRKIVGVSVANIKTDNAFKNDLRNLEKVIDTLGNNFSSLKQEITNGFVKDLSEKEVDVLNKVAQIYKSTIENYMTNNEEDIWSRSYGLNKNRQNYYRLISQWQLRHPNQRLFIQNNRTKLPRLLDKILARFDEYLGEENYTVLEEGEIKMFSRLDKMNRYLSTPFNHYYGEGAKRKRKLRTFNWLINQH